MFQFQVVIIFSLFNMAFPQQYPGSVSVDTVKSKCPVIGDNACPFAKLPGEYKGIANYCPEFKGGCPFKESKTVGEFQDKLGEMRDKCKGKAAYLEFLTEVVRTAKDKAVDEGTACPFFQTKGGCPFAKDTSGKPILSPDYMVAPMGITLDDIMSSKCPAFGKGTCPYTDLVAKNKGVASKCPEFEDGCPFKNSKTVGEFVEKMTQMRDTCKGEAAYKSFIKQVIDVSNEQQKKLGNWPFNDYFCPFSRDAEGKPLIDK